MGEFFQMADNTDGWQTVRKGGKITRMASRQPAAQNVQSKGKAEKHQDKTDRQTVCQGGKLSRTASGQKVVGKKQSYNKENINKNTNNEEARDVRRHIVSQDVGGPLISTTEMAWLAVSCDPNQVLSRIEARGWFRLIKTLALDFSLENVAPLLVVLDAIRQCPDAANRGAFLAQTFDKDHHLHMVLACVLSENHYSDQRIEFAQTTLDSLASFYEMQPLLFGPICALLGKIVMRDHTIDANEDSNADPAAADDGKHSNQRWTHLRETAAELMKINGRPLGNATEIAKYPSGPKPVDNFRLIPVHPRSQDIEDQLPFLRPNIVQGPYESLEDYLDVHFRLLREDYMLPLRKGIEELRKGCRTSSSLTLYRGVTYKERAINIHNELTGYELKLQRAVCSNETLKYGTLVGLSRDGLQSFEFFICKQIAGNDLIVIPCNEREGRFLQQFVVYDMVELRDAYYESYRHTLSALKHATMLPLQELLVDARDIPGMPIHWYQKSSIFIPFATSPTKSYSLRSLPSVHDVSLNPSQYRAFLLALNKRLCLIQGPPGTGKTHVGLKIVESLLANSVSAMPLLVVCYTNHALDQFLEGMLEFTESIVRIGGRSKSQRLEAFSLDKIRGAERLTGGKERIELRRELVLLKDKLHKIEQQIGHAEGWLLMTPNKLSKFEQSIFRSIKDIDTFLELPRICRTEHETEADAEDRFAEDASSVAELHDEFELLTYSRDHVRTLDTRESVVKQRLWQSRPLGGYAMKKVAEKIRYEFPTKPSPDSDNRKGRGPRQRLTLNEKWRFYATVHWKALNKELDDSDREDQTMSQKQEELVEENEQQSGIASGYDRLLRRLRCKRRVLTNQHQQLSQEINEKSARVAEIVDEHLAGLIRKRCVVGMTTSGAVSRLPLIARLASEIVIVEEAAEVLESHLVAMLPRSTKQLILIGDHKQLEPKVQSYVLEAEFAMTVSLFERMINNGLKYVQLEEQHRMRDEFAQLLVPDIYSRITSAPRVFKYKDISGMRGNLQFFQHSSPERQLGSGHASKTNLFEAELAIGLVKHLGYQGYTRDQIVILTAYKGQHSMINSKNPGVRVSTIDDYQGEESDIVIVSFVRSNTRGSVGFLKKANRVCVALSRAKRGLFCLGNFAMYAQVSALWRSIVGKLLAMRAIDIAWRVQCTAHQTQQAIATAEQFEQKFPNGGCGQPCHVRLDCGHSCDSTCHASQPHPTCRKPCTYIHPLCQHTCTRKCFEPHGFCPVPVTKVLDCGHAQVLPCSTTPDRYLCREPCPKPLDCGHPCRNGCPQPCSVKCYELVPVTRSCGHDAMAPCHEKDASLSQNLCEVKVTVDLACGHRSSTTCARSLHPEKLMAKCFSTVHDVRLPGCGHVVDMKCSNHQHVETYVCTENVDVQLTCGHRASTTCHSSGEVRSLTNSCAHPVETSCQRGHTVTLKCHLAADASVHCTADVVVRMKCGHDAITKCNRLEVDGHLESLVGECTTPVNAQCRSGHTVQVACNLSRNAAAVADRCDEVVRDVQAPCGHLVNSRCRSARCPATLRRLCKRVNTVVLRCGHDAQVSCADKRTAQQLLAMCRRQVDTRLPCGHVERQICHGRRGNPWVRCQRICGAQLSCGHVCSGTCYDCYGGRYHVRCPERCSRLCPAGHPCSAPCAKSCPPCKQPCERQCSHGKCPGLCGQACVSAKMGCRKKHLDHCRHQQCSARSCWECTCAPCQETCNKRLPCGHACAGMCGEPCLVCFDCGTLKKEKKAKSKQRHLPPELLVLFAEGSEYAGQQLIAVPGCGHIFPTVTIDTLMAECQQHHRAPQCPTCNAPIAMWRRYNAVFNALYCHAHPSAVRPQQIKARRSALFERVKERLVTARKVEFRRHKQPEAMRNHYTIEILDELLPKIQHGTPDTLQMAELVLQLFESLLDGHIRAMQATQCAEWKAVRNGLNQLLKDMYEALLDLAMNLKGRWIKTMLHDVSQDGARLDAVRFLPVLRNQHRQEEKQRNDKKEHLQWQIDQLTRAILSPARFEIDAVNDLLKGTLQEFGKKVTPLLDV